MPLSDMQLVGLLQLLIEQERNLLLVRAHVIALEEALIQVVGEDLQQRLAENTKQIIASTNFDPSRETIRVLDQTIAQLLPAAGEKTDEKRCWARAAPFDAGQKPSSRKCAVEVCFCPDLLEAGLNGAALRRTLSRAGCQQQCCNEMKR